MIEPCPAYSNFLKYTLLQRVFHNVHLKQSMSRDQIREGTLRSSKVATGGPGTEDNMVLAGQWLANSRVRGGAI